jgi:hypothetical protein
MAFEAFLGVAVILLIHMTYTTKLFCVEGIKSVSTLLILKIDKYYI